MDLLGQFTLRKQKCLRWSSYYKCVCLLAWSPLQRENSWGSTRSGWVPEMSHFQPTGSQGTTLPSPNKGKSGIGCIWYGGCHRLCPRWYLHFATCSTEVMQPGCQPEASLQQLRETLVLASPDWHPMPSGHHYNRSEGHISASSVPMCTCFLSSPACVFVSPFYLSVHVSSPVCLSLPKHLSLNSWPMYIIQSHLKNPNLVASTESFAKWRSVYKLRVQARHGAFGKSPFSQGQLYFITNTNSM